LELAAPRRPPTLPEIPVVQIDVWRNCKLILKLFFPVPRPKISHDSLAIKQGSAETESRKIQFFEKSPNFHGKLDVLNFGKSKM
jgi:hypothetical protein